MTTQTLTRARFTLTELGGGLGDTGLWAPIALALVAVNGLSATAVIGGLGLAYLATGWYFRLPLPVQPMKAFAATAIALKLDADVIALGALMMAAAMALTALTGLGDLLARRCPPAIVRGIQLSVALLLAKAAWTMAQKGNWSGLPHVSSAVGVTVALGVCALLVVVPTTRIPIVLVVLVAAVVTGLSISGVPALSWGPDHLDLGFAGWSGAATAFSSLVIAQLPLTLANSVVATEDVCRDKYGDGAARASGGRLAGSMAVWNTLAGVAHGMPLCHGAGGATAHHSLGARTGGATMMVGAGLLTLAIVAGAGLADLAHAVFPAALAGMLAYVAIQHAALAARLERRSDAVVVAAVGIVSMVAGNLMWGVAAGLAPVVARASWRRLQGWAAAA